MVGETRSTIVRGDWSKGVRREDEELCSMLWRREKRGKKEMKPGMCKFMRRRGFCWREDFNMSG